MLKWDNVTAPRGFYLNVEETHKVVRRIAESARVHKELFLLALQQVKEIMDREVEDLSMVKLLVSIVSHLYCVNSQGNTVVVMFGNKATV